MKRNFIIQTLLIAATLTLTTSCLDDDESYDYYYMYTIGEFVKDSETSYHIASDKGNTIQVGNYQKLLDLGVEPGGRVYAEFGMKMNSDDKTATVVNASSVLVKDIAALTDDNADTVGDDKINLAAVWNSSNYLNVTFQFEGNGTATHYINLVTVDSPKKQEDGYQYLELRHNLNGNTPLNTYIGVASFPIDSYLADTSVKGFIIRTNSFYDGEKFVKYDIVRQGADIQSTGSTGQGDIPVVE